MRPAAARSRKSRKKRATVSRMGTSSSCSNDERQGIHKNEAGMNFELTEEQQLIQDTARRFAAEEIAPTLEAEEAKHEFRADRVAKMGELGFFSCALRSEER